MRPGPPGLQTKAHDTGLGARHMLLSGSMWVQGGFDLRPSPGLRTEAHGSTLGAGSLLLSGSMWVQGAPCLFEDLVGPHLVPHVRLTLGQERCWLASVQQLPLA